MAEASGYGTDNSGQNYRYAVPDAEKKLGIKQPQHNQHGCAGNDPGIMDDR